MARLQGRAPLAYPAESRMQPGLAAPQRVLTGVSTNKSVDGSTSEIFRLQT